MKQIWMLTLGCASGDPDLYSSKKKAMKAMLYQLQGYDAYAIEDKGSCVFYIGIDETQYGSIISCTVN